MNVGYDGTRIKQICEFHEAQMKRHQTPELAEMRRLYEEEHWTLREIAAKFGLTHEGVRYKLAKHGTEMRPPQMRPRGVQGRPIDPDEVRRLYVDKVLRVREIAKRLGATSRRVANELDRLGVEKRPRGFFSRKHRELAELKIGEWIEVEPASASAKPHAAFYGMATPLGIRISIRRIAEGLYRLTRKA